MNKHFISLLLSAFLFAFVFVSCSEDIGEYVRPQFGAITCTPNPVIAGDSVELYIPHKAKGNGIASTTYTWTIKNIGWDADKNEPKDTVIAVEDNYDGYGKRDPQVKFLMPADCPIGYHEVTMKATFSVYIGATLFDWVTVTGRIDVTE